MKEEQASVLLPASAAQTPSDANGGFLHAAEKLSNGPSLVASRARFSVHRDALDQQELEKLYSKEPLLNASYRAKLTKKLRSTCTCTKSCFLSVMESIFPVVAWLPGYKVREYLPSDLISGFTISILHIPQGMAYGLLASVDAIHGLYVSFFPVLIYFFMGTSRHISLGTFAVISLMLSSAADQLETIANRVGSTSSNTSLVFVDSDNLSYDLTLEDPEPLWPPTRIEVLTTMCLITGIWQVLMGVLHLGALTVILSDQLVSGFSTGAAVHVATSQMKDLFDLEVRRFSGPFKIVYTYVDVFSDLLNCNPATVLASAISLFVLAMVKEQVNDRFREQLVMPIPIDVIVVVLGTAISYLLDLNARFHVKIMGFIPTGLPDLTPPRLDIIPAVTVSSLVVAIIAFAISLSMAKIFAKKHKYEIQANQELVALGGANIISSFFLCYPCSASLSRSVVQERSGGKTQVASLVSCMVMLVVLLVMGPLFYTLPKCVLAAIILVALKGMFMQVLDFHKAWRISKTDAFIWMVTFLSVVLVDVDYGLIIGVIFSMMTVLVHSIMPHRTLLGQLPSTDIYLDTKRYREAREIPGVKIFHFGAALYFANREVFRSALAKVMDEACCESDKVRGYLHHILIDCSSFSYIDSSGVDTLLEVTKEYKEQGMAIFLAGCSVPVYDMLETTGYLAKVPQPSVFPTIHDAVLHCQTRPCNPAANLLSDEDVV